MSVASFRATAPLPWVPSSLICILTAFAAWVLLRVPIWALSSTPMSVARSFVNSLQRDVHDLLVAFFSRVFIAIFC